MSPPCGRSRDHRPPVDVRELLERDEPSSRPRADGPAPTWAHLDTDQIIPSSFEAHERTGYGPPFYDCGSEEFVLDKPSTRARPSGSRANFGCGSVARNTRPGRCGDFGFRAFIAAELRRPFAPLYKTGAADVTLGSAGPPTSSTCRGRPDAEVVVDLGPRRCTAKA